MAESAAQEIVPHEQNLPTTIATEENTLMNLIAKMAVDPTADITRLERLIVLRDKEMARVALQAYNTAFAEMKPHLPKVIKAHYNTQTKSNYAKLGDINVEIDPVLGKYGFGTSMKVLAQDENSVTVRIQVRHNQGHTEETDVIMPLDTKGPGGTVNKTGPHALMSSIEYAKRGGLCLLLNISTGDDKDGNDPKNEDVITVEQAADLDKRLRALGGETAIKKFLTWQKIEKIIDLPIGKYQGALNGVADQEEVAANKKGAK